MDEPSEDDDYPADCCQSCGRLLELWGDQLVCPPCKARWEAEAWTTCKK